MNLEASAKLNDVNMRIEQMAWLAGEAFDTKGTEVLRDFLDFGGDEHLQKTFGGLIPDYYFEHCNDDESFNELIFDQKLFGFLVQFATPVRTYGSDKKSHRFSWGHYYTEWVYAETLDGAIEAGLQWAEKMAEHDRHNED